MMAVVECVRLDAPEDPLSIELPQFGVLESARQSFYDLPDPSAALMQFFGSTQLALAPLRRFLDMLEIILAIQNCIQSIPSAIARLSPSPIFNCLKELIRAIKRISELFPPLSYIPPIVDLARFGVTVIDQILDFFSFVDGRLTAMKASLDDAVTLGDTDLAGIVDCSSDDLNKQILNNLDILRGIIPLVQLLMTPVVRLIPNAALGKQFQSVLGGSDALINGVEGIKEQILSTGAPPVLDVLLTPLVASRNAVVQLHNIVAPIIGRPGNLNTRSLPNYQNL